MEEVKYRDNGLDTSHVPYLSGAWHKYISEIRRAHYALEQHK